MKHHQLDCHSDCDIGVNTSVDIFKGGEGTDGRDNIENIRGENPFLRRGQNGKNEREKLRNL